MGSNVKHRIQVTKLRDAFIGTFTGFLSTYTLPDFPFNATATVDDQGIVVCSMASNGRSVDLSKFNYKII